MGIYRIGGRVGDTWSWKSTLCVDGTVCSLKGDFDHVIKGTVYTVASKNTDLNQISDR